MVNTNRYAQEAEQVSRQLGQMPLPKTVQQTTTQTVDTGVVQVKQKFSLPKLGKVGLDPSFSKRFVIAKDVGLVTLVVKLLVIKLKLVADLTIVANVVSFPVLIPVGFALIVAGAATGKENLTVWGAAIAIGSSIALWLFL